VPPAASRDGSIVHVLVETVIVDRGGTQSAGVDEADLVPGTAGVLTREITLIGRDRRRTREPIVLEARLTPEAVPPEGKVCSLRLVAETRKQASGTKTAGAPAAAAPAAAARGATLDQRETVIALADGEERLTEVYASSMTGGRVALKLSCGPALADGDGMPDLVTLDLEVEKRAADEATELRRSQRLVAALGREVSTVVVANQGLPDEPEGGKRYRRERLEAVLSPVVLVAGRLQLEVRITGDITTVSSQGAQTLVPFERVETCLLGNGERRTFDIVVASGAADAGWTSLTLAVEVIPRF